VGNATLGPKIRLFFLLIFLKKPQGERRGRELVYREIKGTIQKYI
jgi:hypothetical protein